MKTKNSYNIKNPCNDKINYSNDFVLDLIIYDVLQQQCFAPSSREK
jgi:hypothetical protein